MHVIGAGDSGMQRDRDVADRRSCERSSEARVIDFFSSFDFSGFGAVVSRRHRDPSSLDREPSQAHEHQETLVTVVGDLDFCTSPLLEECLVGISGDVRVDCAGLDFVDSQGLRVLVASDARTRGMGARFVVVEPSRALQRLFEVTGVEADLDLPPRRA
jgi:anti-sigma B factor antagonist